MGRDILEAWNAAKDRGETVALMANTNETVRQLNEQCQQLLIDTPTDHPAIYTPLTRGRHSNHAYIATERNQAGPEILTHAVAKHWYDHPALARRVEMGRSPKRALPGQGQSIAQQACVSRLGEWEEIRVRKRRSIGLEP